MTRYGKHMQPPPGIERRRAALHIGLLILGLGMLLGTAGSADAAPQPVKRRGRFLRTEIVKTERQKSFTCVLAPSADAVLRLRLHRLELLTHHEVRLYETVLEIKPSEEETDPTKIEYRVVPDEVIEGEKSSRRESVDAGPLANEPVTVDGNRHVTDADGIAVDADQYLLGLFDDLSVRDVTVRVAHAKLGEVGLTLTRDVVRRAEDTDDIERARLAQTDILLAMGLDFCQLKRSSHDDLQPGITIPESPRAGDPFVLELTVSNRGTQPVCGLIGRTFSRHEWLNGRNFYFGNIAAGETRSFERRFVVPETVSLPTVFGAVGFWSILGAVDGAALPVELSFGSDVQ